MSVVLKNTASRLRLKVVCLFSDVLIIQVYEIRIRILFITVAKPRMYPNLFEPYAGDSAIQCIVDKLYGVALYDWKIK